MKFPGIGLIVAAIIVFASASPVHGMDFSINYKDPFTGDQTNPTILMRGEIQPGDYDKLLAFAEQSGFSLPLSQAVLSSPGGDIKEALKIGRLVKQLYMAAYVGRATGYCASACFIIFASAVQRETGPELVGIHRPYLDRGTMLRLSPREAEAAETTALRDAEQYLRDLRVPRNLVDLMFEQASTEIHWLSADEFQYQLGPRPAWYEEFLIARCGFDKAAEQQFLKDPIHAKSLKELAVPIHCGQKLTIGEAKEAYGVAQLDRVRRLAAVKNTESAPDLAPNVERVNVGPHAKPWRDRVADIVARMQADRISVVRAEFSMYERRDDALARSRDASANDLRRTEMGARIEATQTWFQYTAKPTDDTVVLFIHVINPLPNNMSGLLFEIAENTCSHKEGGRSYYVLRANQPIGPGAETVLVTRVPQTAILQKPTEKCGTVREVW